MTEKFPVDVEVEQEEKEKLTLQKILDIQRKKRLRSLGETGFQRQKVFGSKHSEDKHSPGSSINSLVRNDIASTKREKKVKSVLVAVIGQGEIFGDYETFNEKSTHQFSLVCKSL